MGQNKQAAQNYEAGISALNKNDTEKAIEQTVNWYKEYYLKGNLLTCNQIEEFLS